MRATRRHPGAAVAAGWLAGAAVEELQQGLRALCRRPEAFWGVCVCRARVLSGAGVLAECLWGRATFTFLDPSLGLKSQQSASGRRARALPGDVPSRDLLVLGWSIHAMESTHVFSPERHLTTLTYRRVDNDMHQPVPGARASGT